MAVTLFFCDTCSEKHVKDVKAELENLFQKKQVDLFSCGICCRLIPVRKELIRNNLNHQECDVNKGMKSEPEWVGKDTDVTPNEMSHLRNSGRQSHNEELGSKFNLNPSVASDAESDSGSNYSDEMKSKERKSKTIRKEEKKIQKKDTASVTGKTRNILEITDLNPQFTKDAILEGSLTSKKYACKFCKKEFKFSTSMVKKFCFHLGEHMEQAQVPKPYKCPVCETCFMGFSFLKKHTKDHANPTCYQCPHPDCDRTFKYKKSMNSHEETMHKDLEDIEVGEVKSYVCEICGVALMHRRSLKKHMLRHQESKPFKCGDCDKCFIDKANLNRHRERHNESKKTMCEVCGKTFVLLNELKTHRITHTDERLYQCEYCPYRAKRLGTLRAHIRNIHTEADPNKFKCNYCGLIFLSATACTKHQKKHQGGTDVAEHLLKPYQCSDCGYRARKPCYIRIHRRSHTGEKPFKCIYCERAFTQNGQCKRHMKICKKR